jgi:hypothetical protein
MKTNVLFLAVGLLALSGNVFADISETFTNTTPTTDFGFTDNFTLTSFDTNLGALTGITIDLVSTGTANVSVINISGSANTFSDATVSIPLTVSGPAGITPLVTITGDGPVAGTVGSGFGPYIFTGVPTTSSATENVDAGLFSEFESVGPVALNFSAAAETGTFGGSGTGVLFSGTGDISAVTSITYTYTPNTVTPEPALLGVVSLCLGGVVLFRRKSLKKS